VIYALPEAGSRGWGDAQVVGFGLAGIAALAAFVIVELRAERPMIDLRLFRYRLFTAGSAVLFFSNAGFGGVIFLLPLLLQAEKGMSPLESGLTTFPQAIGVMMMAPLAGKLYPRIGPRRLLLAGMTGTTLMVLAFRYVGLETTDWTIRALMLVNGWMFALGLVPMQAAAFAEIRVAEAGHASAAFSVLRQVASSFGVALIATMLTSRLAAHGAVLGNPQTREGAVLAFQDSYLVAAVITGISILATFLIKDKLAAGTMRRVPDPEMAETEVQAEEALVGAH
jgi:MFS family permease